VHVRGAAQSTLPLHVAKKKIPCLDAAGALVTPEAPNGVKLEMFIFDSFPVAKKVRGPPTRQPTQPADLPPYIPPT
jgi:UDP-N-acetylglucosamine pyrophosphorylase